MTTLLYNEKRNYGEKNKSLDYLPELYQNCENSFTERFLTIFTDIYSQFEREIDTSSKIYDPELCPDEFIEWLGKWISVENMQLFPDDKKENFLLLTPWLSKHRGTISGMKKLLKLYCGTDVFIVEYYHVKRYFSSCKALERIYNGGRFYSLDPFIRSHTDYTTAYLCIEYDEKQSQPIHSIAKTVLDDENEGPEYNRITEGYSLYITDEEPEKFMCESENLALKRKILISDGINVSIICPSIVREGEEFILKLR